MKLSKFPKKYKLKRHKPIEKLFKEGQNFKAHALKIIYLKHEEKTCQVAFSVSKKKFPKAVDRNLIKRRMRAAFQSLNEYPKNVHLMLIYIGDKKNIKTLTIKKSIEKLIRHL